MGSPNFNFIPNYTLSNTTTPSIDSLFDWSTTSASNPVDGMINWNLAGNSPSNVVPIGNTGFNLDNMNFMQQSDYTPSLMDRMFGWTDKKTNIQHGGALMPALGAFTGLGNLWLGMEQRGIAKDALKHQKQADINNWRMSVAEINRQLDERYARQVAVGDTTARKPEPYDINWRTA